MNIESLSIDQMRAALAVAELGSFSGAARRFSRAQSAVSYAVMTLERQLGVAHVCNDLHADFSRAFRFRSTRSPSSRS